MVKIKKIFNILICIIAIVIVLFFIFLKIYVNHVDKLVSVDEDFPITNSISKEMIHYLDNINKENNLSDESKHYLDSIKKEALKGIRELDSSEIIKLQSDSSYLENLHYQEVEKD